jgi:hypothetical protein
MQRRAHQRRLDHDVAPQSALERLSAEAVQARPESDVGGRRELRLQAGEPLDRQRR